jgi:hypothetical protein
MWGISPAAVIYSRMHGLTNTLILSKLWYSLRVVSLLKHFFKQTRSIIYQFTMKGIKPVFQHVLQCRPIINWGRSLLDSMIQHRCLQFAGYNNRLKMTILSPAVKCRWKILFNELHCNASVSQFDPTIPAACSLCHDP